MFAEEIEEEGWTEFDDEVYEAPSWQGEIFRVDPNDFQNPDYLDFRNMVHLCLRHLLGVDPTPLQYEIASEIENGPPEQIICGFRGLSKSWMTAFFVIWVLYWNPKENILVLSAGKAKAAQFTHMVLGLLRDIPELRWLYPLKTQRQSGLSFDVAPAGVSQMPSVMAAGVFSAITGFRAGLVVGDDVEIPENSDTVGKREKLIAKLDEAMNAIMKPVQKNPLPYTLAHPRGLLLGTPQSEESMYTTMEKDHNFEFTMWPIAIPGKEDAEFFGPRLAPSIRKRIREEGDACIGEPVDPWRFPAEEIQRRKDKASVLFWKLQFELSTRLSDAERYPLRTRDFIVMDLAPDVAPQRVVWSSRSEFEIGGLPIAGFKGDGWFGPQTVSSDDWIPYTQGVLAIDPSGRGKDETTYSVVKVLNGNMFLLEQGGFMEGYEDSTLEKLAEVVRLYKLNTVVYEDNFGDGMFGKLLSPFVRKAYPAAIEGVTSKGQKEKRVIGALEGPLRLHRCIVNQSVIEKDRDAGRGAQTDDRFTYRMFWQLTHITYEKNCLPHDDRVESFSIAVQWLSDILYQDQDQQNANWQESKDMLADEENYQDLVSSTGGSSSRRSQKRSDTAWAQNAQGGVRPSGGFSGSARGRVK